MKIKLLDSFKKKISHVNEKENSLFHFCSSSFLYLVFLIARSVPVIALLPLCNCYFLFLVRLLHTYRRNLLFFIVIFFFCSPNWNWDNLLPKMRCDVRFNWYGNRYLGDLSTGTKFICDAVAAASLFYHFFPLFFLSTRCHRERNDLCSNWCCVFLSRELAYAHVVENQRKNFVIFSKCVKKKTRIAFVLYEK